MSLTRMVGVHPDLIRVIRDCAENFEPSFKFGVSEGLRTLAQQKLNMEHGVSETMNSRHLDGHAADLVALFPGDSISWSWPLYFRIAGEMRAASLRTKVPVIWGGCWDEELASLGNDMATESHGYVERARRRGQKGFLDGPHYELPWATYPSAKIV